MQKSSNMAHRGPFDLLAERISAKMPSSLRVGMLGSTLFHHPTSERVCAALGEGLARVPGLLLVAAGVSGVRKTCSGLLYGELIR
jgi:hypothetical protein